MAVNSILLIGGYGYLGRNFNSLFSKKGINVRILNLSDLENLRSGDFGSVIDLSMLNRQRLPWNDKMIRQFKISHEDLLDEVVKRKLNYIRISSIFDVRSFSRNDDYTKLSKQISTKILQTVPEIGKIIYSHSVYGGSESNSFIDNAILTNKFITESLRDYLHIEDLSTKVVEILNNYESFSKEIEIGTAKPYLSTDIQKYLLEQNISELKFVDPSSIKFQQLADKELVCSAIQNSIPGISQILVEDKLPEYLAISKSN